MNYTNIFKRQTSIILISVIAIGLIVLGISYAVFTDRKEANNTQTLTAGRLSATFTQGTTLNADAVPLADEDAATAENNSYTFNLTNSGTLPIHYELTIFNNVTEENATNLLAHKYIKVKFDNETPVYLDKLSKKETGTDENSTIYILKEGSIANGVSNQAHTIRIWIAEVDSNNEETDTDIIGKKIDLKIGLNGSVQE